MESRRLSGRRAGALRRMPYAAQCARRGAVERAVCRRRRRQLACLCDQRPVAVAGAVDRRCVVSPICATAGIPITASRADRWRRWSAICLRCRKATSAPSRPIWPSVFGAPTPDRKRRGDEVLAQAKSPRCRLRRANPAGAAIYAAACASCHESGRPLPYGGINLGSQHRDQQPGSAQRRQHRAVGRPPRGRRAQSDHAGLCRQHERSSRIAALLSYLRARFSNQPAWTGLEKTIADARRTQTVFLQTSPGPHNAPADATQRDKP